MQNADVVVSDVIYLPTEGGYEQSEPSADVYEIGYWVYPKTARSVTINGRSVVLPKAQSDADRRGLPDSHRNHKA